MYNVRLALDWPPNCLHAGILASLKMGLYDRNGLNLIIQSTADDVCRTSPIKNLINGNAHIAIAPSESLISFHSLRDKYDLIAIAALNQKNNSAVVTQKLSGISRPAELDGKIYASYRGRFENAIIQQMIKNDGGSGMIRFTYPDKFQIWDDFITGKVHAAWVFNHREGLMARSKAIELNQFHFEDYGIPYGYNSVMITRKSLITEYPDVFREFLRITGEGYQYAVTYPDQTAEMFNLNCKFSRNLSCTDLKTGINTLRNDFLDNEDRWGTMETSRWSAFLGWLDEHRIVTDLETKEPVSVLPKLHQIFTNNYLSEVQYH